MWYDNLKILMMKSKWAAISRRGYSVIEGKSRPTKGTRVFHLELNHATGVNVISREQCDSGEEDVNSNQR